MELCLSEHVIMYVNHYTGFETIMKAYIQNNNLENMRVNY